MGLTRKLRPYHSGRTAITGPDMQALAQEVLKRLSAEPPLELINFGGGKHLRLGAALAEEATALVIDGPFKGEIDPLDGRKIVVGKDRAESDYKFRDTITIGIETLEKTVAETTVNLPSTRFVFYEISKTNLVITATLSTSVAYPVQTDTSWKVVLGRADVTAGLIARFNLFRFPADIELPGRVN